MEREDVEQASSDAAQAVLWLSGDIEMSPLEVLELIVRLLELLLDVLTKNSGRAPK